MESPLVLLGYVVGGVEDPPCFGVDVEEVDLSGRERKVLSSFRVKVGEEILLNVMGNLPI